MNKVYEIASYLSSDDVLDIRIEVGKGEVLGFSINYRILVDDDWCQVYRVDTAHGYLHEQRYWIGTESIPLKSKEARFATRKELFSHCLDDVKQNHELYRKLRLEKLKESGRNGKGKDEI